jgi:hypothetical protein
MDAFKTKLVDIAESNMRLPDGIAGPLKRIFEESGNSGLGLKHERIEARSFGRGTSLPPRALCERECDA